MFQNLGRKRYKSQNNFGLSSKISRRDKNKNRDDCYASESGFSRTMEPSFMMPSIPGKS